MGRGRDSLIYGADDRRELYQIESVTERRAARATAAMIPKQLLPVPVNGSDAADSTTLGSDVALCPGERFSDQPDVSECTAVLIDDNLLATAGHCIRGADTCESRVFAFDYVYSDAREPGRLGPLEAIDCRAIRVEENDPLGGDPIRDYAIIELSRSVEGREPIPIRTGAPEKDEPLSVIGTTEGVPLKVDEGARLLEPRSGHGDYFILESDTFHGSSGAPVLDADGRLLGLFVRGAGDYVWDHEHRCNKVVQMPGPTVEADGGVVAEEASYVTLAIEALCRTGYPSRRLCGIDPVCGDAVCSPGETDEACPSDCTRGDGHPFSPSNDAERSTAACGVTRPDTSSIATRHDGCFVLNTLALLLLVGRWRRVTG